MKKLLLLAAFAGMLAAQVNYEIYGIRNATIKDFLVAGLRYFGDKDPTTRVMMEGILTNEEEHAYDMHDLLVAHEGRPMLPSN
jgi:bacterioferritin (cytochrome b1)